ncbi:putative Mannan endo-1,6-alpha-mannosidase DCW1 [Glarea lozoyensis 74030]|nr:putative Mannan endo-1,6-alpha-mannosidase DCW1 [Glarea lozoyensis 74030]
MLLGAGVMYNFTGDQKWQDRTERLLQTLSGNFFVNGVMREGCENPVGTQIGCNQDQKSFKAYLSRWLTVTSIMVPSTAANITALLRTSAKAAAAQCTGGPRGTECGIQWDKGGKWDGTTGVGQSMSALEVMLGSMIGLPQETGQRPKPPVTGDTGGTSISIPTAGNPIPPTPVVPATKKDRAGAWFITVLIALIALFMCYFMWTEAFEHSASTIGGVAARNKGKGRVEEREKGGPERVIIDLATGKRRSLGVMSEKGETGAPVGSGGLPIVEEVMPTEPKMVKGDRASLPRWRGGDWVT